MEAMIYKCLKENSFKDNEEYQIIAIRQEDVESIRLWRNAQIDVLRQKAFITFEDQQHYFQKHVWPTFAQERPTQILFSFLLGDTCIGYGGFTYLDWENSRSEVSFLVDPTRAQDSIIYPKDFTHFLKLLCFVAFEHLHLHRLFTETFAFRHSTLHVLEKLGFQQEGILREHIYKHGQWVNSIMHGLLAKDWKSEIHAQ
jgi:RimJ/RimL family protein N-acetyltransferase